MGKGLKSQEVELLRPSRGPGLLAAMAEISGEARRPEMWAAVPLQAVPELRRLLARTETNLLLLRKQLGL